jgi:hypothetical protein
VSDPSNKIGADCTNVVLFVPVGGQTTLWSLKRYQALAASDTDLPSITVPVPVGDPTLYPASPQTLAGQPIPTGQLVLGGSHVYRTSDVGLVGWQLTSADQVTTTVSTSITTSAIGQVRLGTVVVYGETDGTLATQYSVSIGQAVCFGGWVPPIKDDLAANGYSFTPIVYADPGGYFVVSYTVGP